MDEGPFIVIPVFFVGMGCVQPRTGAATAMQRVSTSRPRPPSTGVSLPLEMRFPAFNERVEAFGCVRCL